MRYPSFFVISLIHGVSFNGIDKDKIQNTIQYYLDVIDSFYNKQISFDTLFNGLQQFVIKDKFTANYNKLKQIGTSKIDKVSMNYEQYMKQLNYRSRIKIKDSSKHIVNPIESINRLNNEKVVIKTKAIQSGKVKKLNKDNKTCIFDESVQLLQIELIKQNEQWNNDM